LNKIIKVHVHLQVKKLPIMLLIISTRETKRGTAKMIIIFLN